MGTIFRNAQSFRLAIPVLMFMACDSSTEPVTDPNVTVSMSDCHDPEPVIDRRLRPKVYISKDSLEFTIRDLHFQCGTHYAFAYPTVVEDTLLRMRMEIGKNSGVKCVCEQDVRFGIRSKGEDFTAIQSVELNGVEYPI
jgi:hypothetical protein